MIRIKKESSLSRAYEHMMDHDCGVITAFRNKYTYNENMQRNKKLMAQLLSSGYGVTTVQGSYIENFKTPQAVEVKEVVFFVVDLKDKGRLENDLRILGEEQGDELDDSQDSIMFIPQGSNTGIIIGTSKLDTSFPGYGKKITYPNSVFGSTGEFMTKIHGRPLQFKEKIGQKINPPDGYLARQACKTISNKKWQDIEL